MSIVNVWDNEEWWVYYLDNLIKYYNFSIYFIYLENFYICILMWKSLVISFMFVFKRKVIRFLFLFN